MRLIVRHRHERFKAPLPGTGSVVARPHRLAGSPSHAFDVIRTGHPTSPHAPSTGRSRVAPRERAPVRSRAGPRAGRGAPGRQLDRGGTARSRARTDAGRRWAPASRRRDRVQPGCPGRWCGFRRRGTEARSPASGLSAVSAPRSLATSASARSATPLPLGHVAPRRPVPSGCPPRWPPPPRHPRPRTRHVVLAVTDGTRRPGPHRSREEPPRARSACVPRWEDHRRIATADHLAVDPQLRDRRGGFEAAG